MARLYKHVDIKRLEDVICITGRKRSAAAGTCRVMRHTLKE